MKALTFSILPLCLLASACGESRNNPQVPVKPPLQSITLGNETCILDPSTQLLWQTKSTDSGLHHVSNTYSWFDPDEAHGELDYRGLEDGGTCEDSKCDTWHYVQAVNAKGLCGYNDWRVPGKDEIYSISDIRRLKTPPTIDTDYFPLTQAAEYWTSNDYSFQYDTAWAWNFALGHDRVDWKREAKFVRLVRGTAGDLEKVKE